MKCSKIERKLALLQELTADELQHIGECPRCAEFADDIRHFRARTSLTTPFNLKNHVLASCQAELGEHHSSLLRRVAETWRSPKAAIALSVLSVVTLIASAIIQFYSESNELFCRLSALFLLIVLLQNIIAAICAPILVQHKAALKN
ncbi:hypothetical protein JXA02_11775 [candidate division KSB1 bacterium]|nr:hypothetical protein [candidate division KSB1 bacterium]RQW02107.1 MAG: hypothetical protein EH222_14105 [candidate division KSB1 bacterium]